MPPTRGAAPQGRQVRRVRRVDREACEEARGVLRGRRQAVQLAVRAAVPHEQGGERETFLKSLYQIKVIVEMANKFF